ncbi:PssE/Cps14G family polysaccharide biosynthesis glycosyltransferase [Niallia oryzisoli]|uniref:PssE/Cps14G family polysaccharide biosynthesis glycosyltransferase n=1 Tax=Niallia oryzisoli TaxID=1737571 RepID=A0ABZ2CED8_9BACI
MIFVVLGTFELPFDRLLKEVDKQISAGNIKEEVLVQAGHTKYRSNQMKFIDFTTYEHMAELYREASFIITHGGTGSITMGMKMGKKIIAVPRLVKYGEHNDNHQIEIVKQFCQTGHILSWDDATDMSEVLKEIQTFKPAPFKSGNKEILNILRNFIDSV